MDHIVRRATPEDRAAILRLVPQAAALATGALVAVRDERVVAAIAIRNGRIASEPGGDLAAVVQRLRDMRLRLLNARHFGHGG